MSTSRDVRAAKLHQIIQNFFSKAAQVVIVARASPAPRTQPPKSSKWFNLELEEDERYRYDLHLWRTVDPSSVLVPPLVVETYLDLRGLSDQQSLVYVDPHGRSWNATRGLRRSEVVLERWVVELIPADAPDLDLPVIYKRAIIVLRALYTFLHLMPTWNLQRKLSKAKLNVSPMSIGCRVLNGAQPISSRGRIGLTKNLTDEPQPSDTSHLENLLFSPVDTSLGSLRISVSYRSHVDFRTGDSEALLSKHFLNIDRQGLPTSQQELDDITAGTLGSVSGSASGSSSSRPALVGSVGSAASAATGTSTGTPQPHAADYDVPSSPQPIAGSPVFPRPSVSFIQPFKSPSMAASPIDTGFGGVTGIGASGVSPRKPSFTRIPSNSSFAALRIPRRTSSTTSAVSVSGTSVTSSGRSIPSAGYAGPSVPETFPASYGSSAGSSVPRYSSSFGSRGHMMRSGSISSSRYRPPSFMEPSSVGSNYSASGDPGSGIYLPNNDLGDFVKMVDSSHRPFGEGSGSDSEGSTRQSRSISPATPLVGTGSTGGSTAAISASSTGSARTGNPLARFQMLRGNHSALSDSLQSSMYQPRPDSSTSYTSVTAAISPGVAAPSASPSLASSPGQHSLSTSLSPAGKGLAHTPVVPSRLSEELTVHDKEPRQRYRWAPSTEPRDHSRSREFSGSSDVSGSSPLDIPMSSSPASLHTRLMRSRRESLSLSNRRTSGYDEMRQSPGELDSHHQSLGRGGFSGSRSRRNSYYLQDNDSSHRVASFRRGSNGSGSERPALVGRTSSSGANPLVSTYEDDDLLFAMSDMHVTETPHQAVHGPSQDEPSYGQGDESYR